MIGSAGASYFASFGIEFMDVVGCAYFEVNSAIYLTARPFFRAIVFGCLVLVTPLSFWIDFG